MLVFAQSSIASNLVVGVVSGLITSIAIFVFSIIWLRHLVPWYEQRVYKGISLQGTWSLVDNSETEPIDRRWTQIETFDISQVAQRITGTLTLTPKDGNDGAVVALTLIGEIIDRFVTMTMKSPSRNRLSYGVFLGQVIADGNRMVGQTAYYDVQENEITAAKVTYERKK